MTQETTEQPGAAPDPSAAPQSEPEAKPDALQKLETRIDDVLKELVETKNAARRTQGESSSHANRLNRELAELRATIADLQTRDMTPEQRESFKAQQALRAYESQARQQQDYAQQAAVFEQEAAQVLAKKGIKSDDARLQQAYQQYAQERNTPEGWRLALGLAIADLEADERRKVQEERQKLLDDLQTRQRNETRREAGPVDRGAPTSGGGTRPSEMTDEEFNQHLSRLNAEARKRLGR